MAEPWYQKAIIYCLDAETFQDSDGDGAGDFAGLTRRLDYLGRLGIDCLWLNPIHPSPGRDGGYDITDYYNVHPRLGTLGDFAVFLEAADSRGIRVIIDLVVNHTSDEHPWFRSARSSADSPYRDWYVWSGREPADRRQGIVFPGEQKETWTYDKTAGAWYYHRFYRFQPDLNISNLRVRDEIKKIASFWLRLGVAGFRMDAVPFLIESTNPDGSMGDRDFGFLTELRQHVQWQRRDALLLAEANVDPDRLTTYFGMVNVRAQRNDHGSLLSWFEQMMRTLRECPEINTGSCTHVDVPTRPAYSRTELTTRPAPCCSCTTSTTRTPPSTSAASPTSPNRPRRCSPTATTATSTWLSSRSAATATAGSACAENCPVDRDAG